MIQALLDDEVEVVLLDTYTAGEYSTLLDHPLLRIKKIIKVKKLSIWEHCLFILA